MPELLFLNVMVTFIIVGKEVRFLCHTDGRNASRSVMDGRTSLLME